MTRDEAAAALNGNLTRDEIEALITRLEMIAVAIDHPATMIGIAYDRRQLPADAIRAARALKQLLGRLDDQHIDPGGSRGTNHIGRAAPTGEGDDEIRTAFGEHAPVADRTC